MCLTDYSDDNSCWTSRHPTIHISKKSSFYDLLRHDISGRQRVEGQKLWADVTKIWGVTLKPQLRLIGDKYGSTVLETGTE